MANIFYGGVFSVASVLATSLYLLAHHPDEEGRLRAEVRGLSAHGGDFDRVGISRQMGVQPTECWAKGDTGSARTP